jgi:hypothetical protein
VATTPTVRGVTEGSGASSTTHTITFTQTTGDRVVIFLANDSTARTWSLGDSFVNLTNTSATFHIFTKVLDGSEGGNMVATAGVATKSAWLAYNITTGTHASGTAPVFSTVATGTDTSPNSGSLSPSGGSAKYLWLSAFGQAGEEADDDTWCSAAPSTPGTFTGLVQKTTGTSGAVTINGSVAAAQYASETATVDPGAFTVAQSLAWRAYTVAIYPYTQTNYTQTAGDSLGTLSEGTVRVSARARTGADTLAVSYYDTVLALSPVSYWRLNEATPGTGTATDVMGARNGTYVGSPTGGVTGAIVDDTDKAVTFVKNTSAAYAADAAWPANWTLVGWMYPTTLSPGFFSGILSQGDGSVNSVLFGMEDGGALVAYLGTARVGSGQYLTVNAWNYLVCTFDGTYVRVYLNGELVFGPTSASYSTPGGNFGLVGRGDVYWGPTGTVDELAFYNRVLSAAEVKALRAVGQGRGSISEAAVGVKTGEGAAKVRTAGDTVGTLSDATVRAFVGTRAVAGTTIGTLSEAATRFAARARTAGDTIGTLSEAAVRIAARARTVAGEAIGTLSEAATRAFVGTRRAGDTVGTLSEAAVRAVAAKVRSAGDTVGTLSEAAVRSVTAWVRTAAGDTIGTLSEAAVRIAARARTAGDTVGTLSESVVRVIGWVRSAGDSIGTLSETAVRAVIARLRSAGDTLGTLSEAVTRAFVGTRSAGDTVGTLSEAVARLAARARTAGDTVGTLSEAAVRAAMAVVRSAGAAIDSLSEAVVGVKGGVQAWVATAGDAIGTLSEAVSRAFVGARSAGDTVGSLSEAAARIAARARAAGDTVGTLSEAAIRTAIDRIRTAGDTVGTLTEAAVRAAAAKVRAAGDTVGSLSEAVVGVKSGVVAWVATAGDAIGSLGESIVRAFVGTRAAGDTVGTLTEAAVRIAARARAAGDSIPTLGEAVSRLGAFLRPVGDTVPTLTEVVVGVQAGLHAFVRAASDVIGSLLESAGWPVNPGGAGPRGTAGRTGIDATASHDEPSGTATRATSAGTAGHDEPDATAAHQEPRV